MNDQKNDKAAEIYWLNRLSGEIPKIELPGLVPGFDGKGTARARMVIDLPEEISRHLQEVGKGSHKALLVLFLGGLNVILNRHTGSEDILVGTLSPTQEGKKPGILFLRNKISPDAPLKEVLNRSRSTTMEAFQYTDISFGMLLSKLMAANDGNTPEIFNLAFIYDRIHEKSRLLKQFGLVLILGGEGDKLTLELDYREGLYSPRLLDFFARGLIHVLADLRSKLEMPVRNIDIISPLEKEELAALNRTETSYPLDTTIQSLFEAQVKANPHNPALVGSSLPCGADDPGMVPQETLNQLNYKELNERANRLAHLLKEKGVGPGRVVGLLLERSLDMVVAQLAVLKAGGAYLPIDTGAPVNRLTAMLDDCGVSILLTQGDMTKQYSYTVLQGLESGGLKVYSTQGRSRIADFNEMPLPDRSYIDNEKYNRLLGQSLVKNRILIQASRGCPHDCSYCYRIWPRRQVARTGENLFNEIKLYYDIGIRKFDIFMINIKSGKRLFELIIENGIKDLQLYFPNGFRGDLLTHDYVDLMVEAGTVNFALALETASPRLQKLINKKLNLERFRDTAEYVCKTHPQVVLELFTLHGIPTETEEEARMTMDFIKSLRWVHFPYVNVLKIYHGTRMEEIAIENGISGEAIARSENLAWHELSDTLPFSRSFSSQYQGDFLNDYVLSKERLLQVLPHQIKIMTEDELVKKYDSYLPADIKSFEQLLEFTGIQRSELGDFAFVDEQEDEKVLEGLNERVAGLFPKAPKTPDALRILFLDLSQFFDDGSEEMLYDVVDPPLGMVYLLSYLDKYLGDKIHGKILKPRIDFESMAELRKIMDEFDPQVIAVRSLTYYKDFFHQTLAAIGQWGFNVPVITGGPYATVDYKSVLQDRNVDLVVLSEGEVTFLEILEKMIENGNRLPGDATLKEIPGIVFVPREEKMADIDGGRQILKVDTLGEILASRSQSDPEPVNSPNDLAYVIYTSGSTGKPKGVLVEHRGAVNVVQWFGERYELKPGSRVIQLTNYTFDPSVEQIFSTLIHGATVYLAGKDLLANKAGFLKFMEENRITLINFVPVTLREMLFGSPRLPELRTVISGGEKLDEVIRNQLIEMGYDLYNHYGPTETTVDALAAHCTQGNVTLGKPIANTSTYILDKNFNPVPTGVTGELFIGGVGVTRGYLNRPELTDENFLEQNGLGRLYRTGDRVRLLPDGEVQFIGRNDHQVKIRGHRIELEEIENRLLVHPRIKEAVVTVAHVGEDGVDETGSDDKSEKFLRAFLVCSQPITQSELRSFLAWDLPDYMVPSQFTLLDAFPLTSTGKVDRPALETLGSQEEGEQESPYVAPQSIVEKEMAGVWQQVLNKEPIGIEDNFFMLGGDSVKSIQIASRMNSLGYRLEMRDLFHNPTIAALAPLVKKTVAKTDQSAVIGPVPLTPIQWDFFQRGHRDAHHFNQAVMLNLPQGVDEALVKAVFTRLQKHHDALRMVYSFQDENVRQENWGLDYPFSLETKDFREIGDPGKAQEELNLAVAAVHTGIDLEKGPLMKLGLFRLPQGNRLLIVVHHLVIDGLSWRILFEDMEQLFQQHNKGEEFSLPPKTDSFKKWAEELKQYADSPVFLKEKEYWRSMEDLEIPFIPKDRPGDNLVADKTVVKFNLGEKETEDLLTRVNKAFGSEINDILLTALALAVQEIYGQNRLLIALEGHGREEILEDVNISRTVGWFTSLFPVIIEIEKQNELSGHIRQVKESLRRIPNKGIGYGILRFLTSPEKRDNLDFKLQPRMSFNYLGQFDADVQEKSFSIARESAGSSQSPLTEREYELDVSGLIAGNRLGLSIAYGKNQFQKETIEKLAVVFKEKLLSLIDHCLTQKERVFSPSDFTYKNFPIPVLDKITSLVSSEIEDIYILTPMQSGMLFQALLDPTSTAYFEQMSYRLKGKIQIDLVEKTISELYRRYDVLRTNFFYEENDRPLQVVLKEKAPQFHSEDIRTSVPVDKREEWIETFKETDRNTPFDLRKDSLMRVCVIQVEDEEFEFLWSHHHILMDGWCAGILVEEFFEIYSNLVDGTQYALPPITPFRNYLEWLEKQDMKESRRYWQDYLSGYSEAATVPSFEIPESREQGYRREICRRVLDKEKSAKLQELANRYQVTMNTLVQLLWGLLLGHYNGTRDVVFGSVVSGRPSQVDKVESIVGLFINTIPVRINSEEGAVFSDLLKNLQEQALESEPHHYISLANIQGDHSLKQRLLDHVLIFENYPLVDQIEGVVTASEAGSRKMDLSLSRSETYEQTNYDFNVIVVSTGTFSLKLEYNANKFTSAGVERIAAHFFSIIEQIMDNTEKKVEDITLLTEEEKQILLYKYNETGAPYPREKSLHRLFEEQVERVPDHQALLTLEGDISLSYRDLNNKANCLASLLRERGVEKSIVGIVSHRSMEALVAIMAVLKAGAAFLPIDPEYPHSRKRFMVEDSGLTHLLVQEPIREENMELLKLLPQENTISLNDSLEFGKDGQTENPESGTDPGDIAYVIYTSGSTGMPKGVMVKHAGAVNYIHWAIRQYVKGAQVNFPLFTSLSFDLTITSMFTPLLSGNSVVIFPAKIQEIPMEKLVEDPRLGVIKLTPSHLKLIIEQSRSAESKLKNSVKKLIMGGEALETKLAKQAVESFSEDVVIFNEYGPTEATVGCMIYAFNPESDNRQAVPVGIPADNAHIYLLDKQGNPVPKGIPGEMYISGDGLARGYLNRPELTAEKFLDNPFFPGMLMYKTGDSARFIDDGNMEFLGRIDEQVKIRGFRVELGEIENILISFRKDSPIKDVRVLDRRIENGEHQLVAFIVSEDTLTVSQLREYLVKEVPGYMIPSHFVQVDEIPLTANGKVDKKALLAKGSRLESGAEYVAPQKDTEKQISQIWSEVLNVERVSIYDNFFDLGGNSLNIIQVNNKIKAALERDIPIVTMFEYPTIASLVGYLEKEEGLAEELEQFDAQQDEAMDMMEQTLQIIQGESDD